VLPTPRLRLVEVGGLDVDRSSCYLTVVPAVKVNITIILMALCQLNYLFAMASSQAIFSNRLGYFLHEFE
jgi:hypothetical protein